MGYLEALFSFNDALSIMVWLLVAAAFILVFYMLTQFKHKLTVYETVNNRRIVFEYKAREVKDSDGIVWWQLNKKFRKIKAPPPDAVEITSKGRKHALAERTEQESYRYLCIEDTDEKSKVRTLNSDDRQAVLHQLRKSQQHKKQTFKEVILQFGPVMILGMVIIVGMVFAGDIAQPFLDNKELERSMQGIQTEQLQLLKEIKQGIQTIPQEDLSVS